MQVHDTPVRLDSEDFAVTVNVGSGGAGVYYGTSSDPVVLASSGTLVAAGSSFALTTPVWVVSATHGQTADLQLISSTEPSADTTAVTDVRVTSQPVMPESYGARGDGTEHTLGNLYSSLGAAQTAYGGALAPYINTANWTLASIDYLALRAAFAATQAGGAAGAANNGVLELMPNRAYVMGGGSGVTASQPLQFNPNSDPTKRTVVRFNGASVQLSANVTKLFGFGRTADYQTFQGIDIHDAFVDCNSIGESSAVLLGTLRAGSHTSEGQRANFRHIRIFNPRGVNIPTNDASYSRQFISIASQHVHTNEGDANWNPNGGSQTSLEHILVENARIDGGAYGIALVGVLGTAHTSNAVINTIDGTRKIITFSGKTAGSFIANEWISLGYGAVYERNQIASIVDNGDGTGTVTLNNACSTQLAAAVSAAANTQPIVFGYMTNVYYDDIIVRGGYHDTGQLPNPGGGTTGGNAVQVGGNAFGRTVIIEDFRGVNCHDDTFEIDSALDLQMRNCEVIDPQNVGFLPRNFCVPQTKENATSDVNQIADITDCRVRVKDYNPTTSGRATGFVPGYVGVHPGPVYGTLKLQGFRYTNRTANRRVPGAAIDSYGGLTNFSTLIIKDCLAFLGTSGSDATPAATVGVIHICNPNNCIVELEDVRTLLYGTVTATVTAAQHIFASSYTINGTTATTMRLLVKGANEAYPGMQSVTTGATRHLTVGDGLAGASTANVHADIEGLSWQVGGFGDSQPKTLVIGQQMTAGSYVRFDKLNNVQRSGGVLLHFLAGATPAAIYRHVRGRRANHAGGQISNVLGAGVVGPDPGLFTPAVANGSTAIPLNGPTFTWINDTNFDARLYVVGATTATLIDYSPTNDYTTVNSTYVNLLTQASGAFPPFTTPVVKPGESVRLSYSSGTPTVLADVIT